MLKFLPRQLIIPHAKFCVHNSSVKVLAKATYIIHKCILLKSKMLKNVCDTEARLLTIASKDQSHKSTTKILPQTFPPSKNILQTQQ